MTARKRSKKLVAALHKAMLELYRRAGKETGYWGRRYLQAVRRKGGLATARRMLSPRTRGQRSGLDKLLAANRPDLTLEHLVLRKQFRPLFSDSELAVARERLKASQETSRRLLNARFHPDELRDGISYREGARKKVYVNAFERDPRARKACLETSGVRCRVCDISFAERYGPIGSGFMHVHHLRPLSSLKASYRVNPTKDLIPVCPNCHAMLHRTDPPLTVSALRKLIQPTTDRGDYRRLPQRSAS